MIDFFQIKTLRNLGLSVNISKKDDLRNMMLLLKWYIIHLLPQPLLNRIDDKA